MQSFPILALLTSALAALNWCCFVSVRLTIPIPSARFRWGQSYHRREKLLQLVLNDGGTLLDTTSAKYIFIGTGGLVTLSKMAQDGYSIKDTYLAHDNTSAFGVLDGTVAFGRTDDNFTGAP